VDWVSLRKGQHDRAVDDVKAELLLDRIADAEKIEATDEDVEKEINALAEHSGESATALRARLTKQGALDRMKSKLRSDKTIEWLYSNPESRRQPNVKSNIWFGLLSAQNTSNEIYRRRDSVRHHARSHGRRTDQPRRAGL
jgi:hypothetical protein